MNEDRPSQIGRWVGWGLYGAFFAWLNWDDFTNGSVIERREMGIFVAIGVGYILLSRQIERIENKLDGRR